MLHYRVALTSAVRSDNEAGPDLGCKFTQTDLLVISAVEINTGIIAGALTVFPVFLSKSGAMSFGKSTLSSLRSRLLGRNKTSFFDRRSDSSKHKMHNDNGSYVELNKAAKMHTTPWQDRAKDGGNGRSIVRTDDYEMTSSVDSNIQNTHVTV